MRKGWNQALSSATGRGVATTRFQALLRVTPTQTCTAPHQGRERGLRGDGHVGRELAQRHQDTRVRRGVAEARQRVLDDGEGDAAVEASHAALLGVAAQVGFVKAQA
jgi:hypothetical protein